MPRTFPGPLGLSSARQDQARLDQQSSQESLQPDDQVASGLVRWQDAFDSLQEQEDNVTPVADIKQRHSLRQMLLLVKDLKQPNETDCGLVLADLSGEIDAFMQKSLVDEYPCLTPGCVLDLVNVSLFRPTEKTAYINVHRRSLNSIFPASGTAERLLCAPIPDFPRVPAGNMSKDDSALPPDAHAPMEEDEHTNWADVLQGFEGDADEW
ncbi:MAG: hypothetical protein SGCHY_005015 [Lobulomycetales sp.]